MTYESPRCLTSQYHLTFIRLSVSLWNDLPDPVFDGVGLASSNSRSDFLYWPTVLVPLLPSAGFPFNFFLSVGWYCGVVVIGLIECQLLSAGYTLPAFFNSDNNLHTSVSCPLGLLTITCHKLSCKHLSNCQNLKIIKLFFPFSCAK